MDKYIAIFYATTSGNTRHIAELLQQELGIDRTDIFDIFSIHKDKYGIFDKYDFLIFGSPTYGTGEVHFRWKKIFPFLRTLDFSQKYTALFVLGDQVKYKKYFAHALNYMHKELMKCYDVAILGNCITSNYDYNHKLFHGKKSIPGLVIDQKNEKHLTPKRIKTWVNSFREYIDDEDEE